MGYKERVCKFGSHGGLVGIMTAPDGDVGATMSVRPAIVVSNIGLNHRPGPNRLWATFARRMADHGFVTLRFDMSGLGDSSSRGDKLSAMDRHILDMREAVTYVLQKNQQLSQVALIGLCSGVDPMHAVAAEDPRVSHAMFLDGYHYDTVQHLLNIRVFKLFQPRYYARAQRRFVCRLPWEMASGAEDDVLTREYPSKEKFREDLAAMLARGMRIYACFTGGFAHYYSYKDQFFDMLPAGNKLRGKVEVTMFPNADHLFCGSDLKEDLYCSLERFLQTSLHREMEIG